MANAPLGDLPRSSPPQSTTAPSASSSWMTELQHHQSQQQAISKSEMDAQTRQLQFQFFSKFTQILVQARHVPSLTDRGMSSSSKRKARTKINKWFNLDTIEWSEVREELKYWKHNIMDPGDPSATWSPLVLEFYLDVSYANPDYYSSTSASWTSSVGESGVEHRRPFVLPNHVRGPVDRHGVAMRVHTILLERWELSWSPRETVSQPDLSIVYQDSIDFFRSLFSYSRLLPAYSLYLFLHEHPDLPCMLGYRLRTHPTALPHELTMDSCDQYQFSPIDASYSNRLSPHVTFRTDIGWLWPLVKSRTLDPGASMTKDVQGQGSKDLAKPISSEFSPVQDKGPLHPSSFPRMAETQSQIPFTRLPVASISQSHAAQELSCLSVGIGGLAGIESVHSTSQSLASNETLQRSSSPNSRALVQEGKINAPKKKESQLSRNMLPIAKSNSLTLTFKDPSSLPPPPLKLSVHSHPLLSSSTSSTPPAAPTSSSPSSFPRRASSANSDIANQFFRALESISESVLSSTASSPGIFLPPEHLEERINKYSRLQAENDLFIQALTIRQSGSRKYGSSVDRAEIAGPSSKTKSPSSPRQRSFCGSGSSRDVGRRTSISSPLALAEYAVPESGLAAGPFEEEEEELVFAMSELGTRP